MSSSAKLIFSDKECELPIVEGSEGEIGLNIRTLRDATGAITLDPGYGNTGSCRSAITFIDGEKGILRYRGYPIEQLAQQSTFVEICHLLVHEELPTEAELAVFTNQLTRHSMIHEDMKKFFEGFPKTAHPMSILSSMISSLGTFYTEDEDSLELNIVRLISKIPTIAALSYKKAIGQPSVYPRNELDYTSNFLRMMFSVPAEEYEVPELVANALDMLLILHADHEQNCSTSTARMVGSSGASLFASISAAISALSGPLHGGANQKVIEQLKMIEADGGDFKKYVDKAKDKNDDFRLMGFGHRVYKNFDPRSRILKGASDQVLANLGVNDPLLGLAKSLEEIALKDEYFVERRLYPNVDFYSGIIYRAMGIPTEMFTVMFALGRLPGWIAHWKEMNSDPESRINRPRQIYTGATERDYVAVADR